MGCAPSKQATCHAAAAIALQAAARRWLARGALSAKLRTIVHDAQTAHIIDADCERQLSGVFGHQNKDCASLTKQFLG